MTGLEPAPAPTPNTPDPEPEPPPRPMMGPLFWAMIALAVLCIMAGAAVGLYGARLFPPKPPAPALSPPAHLGAAPRAR